MAGYIGKSQGVTQVDGYNRTEADDRYVNDPDAVITVSGGNVGFGTGTPLEPLDVAGGKVRIGNTKIGHSGSAAAWDMTFETYSGGYYERMRIDSAGRVTMPYQPSWSLQPTSTFGSGATDPIPFGVGGSNKTFANGVSVNAGTVTVPVAGKYFVSCMVRQEGQQTWMELIMKVNGVSIARGGVWYTSSEYETVHSSRVLDLQANDTVSMRMNTGTATFNGNSDTLTFFEGYLIG